MKICMWKTKKMLKSKRKRIETPVRDQRDREFRLSALYYDLNWLSMFPGVDVYAYRDFRNKLSIVGPLSIDEWNFVLEGARKTASERKYLVEVQ